MADAAAQLIMNEPDFVLVARSSQQMDRCQAQLVQWCDRKIAAMQAEADDLAENLDIATRNKWGTGGLSRAHKLAVKRVEYYRKIKLALEAGYVIVPNFPVEMFAIRTNRKTPPGTVVEYEDSLPRPEAEGLPAGEGRYVDDQPIGIEHYQEQVGAPGRERTADRYFATELNEEIDFPFARAKPEILKAAELAMAHKLFDEMGVLPARQRGDPMIVGRIKDPRSTTYNPRWITFLIAWFIDTRDL